MGVFYCCVRGCSSNTSLMNITLFRFPKDPARCLVWVRNCKRRDIESQPPSHLHNNYRVCSLHFEDDMFSSLSKNRLKKNAIPTINLLTGQPQGSTSQLITTTKSSTVQPVPSTAVVEVPQPGTSYYRDVPEFIFISPKEMLAVGAETDVQTQTSKSLTSGTPRKVGLRSQVRTLKRKLSVQEDHSKKSKMNKDDFVQFCEEHFSEALTNFIKTNLDLQQKSPKGHRYSNDYKQFALTIYFLGPKVYKFLSKMFCLPSKSTLYRITKHWNITSGFNEQIFSILEAKVSTMSDIERDCTLCIDEMSIKQFLFYNRSQDKIIGFHESLDGKTYEPAKHVLVLMARGISHNWKQPVAFFFVHKILGEELEKIIFESIRRLQLVGLNILSLISDQRANFVNFTKRNKITDDSPFFFVNDKKIIFMFDVPHLLKSLRINLFKYQIKIGNMITNKKYIEIFYEKDKQFQIRLAPKLTDDHINPNSLKKMKVKLAAQILSATVAAALSTYVALGALPAEASFTATFIEKIDNLFDIFNSYKVCDVKDYNRPFIGSEKQISFLNEMHTFFTNMKVLDNAGKDVTKTLKFIEGWKISIMGFLQMWDTVFKEKHSKIFTRRLNQDCLENFFGKIRQQSGNCRNPTPNQFEQAFKKMFCLHYFENSKGANCIDDFDELLLTVTPDKIKNFQNVLPDKTVFSCLQVGSADYINLELPQKHALNYISGYLMKKCLQRHSCDICTTYSKEQVNLSDEVFFSYFKAYENKNKDTFGNLMMPAENFVEFIYNLENKFYHIFPSLSLQKNAGIKIKEEIKNIPFPHTCKDFNLDYLLSLYVRMRIFYTLKYINRNLSAAKGCVKNVKLSILRHL